MALKKSFWKAILTCNFIHNRFRAEVCSFVIPNNPTDKYFVSSGRKQISDGDAVLVTTDVFNLAIKAGYDQNESHGFG